MVGKMKEEMKESKKKERRKKEKKERKKELEEEMIQNSIYFTEAKRCSNGVILFLIREASGLVN